MYSTPVQTVNVVAPSWPSATNVGTTDDYNRMKKICVQQMRYVRCVVYIVASCVFVYLRS